MLAGGLATVASAQDPSNEPDVAPSSAEEPPGNPYEPSTEPASAIRLPQTLCEGRTIRLIKVRGTRRVDQDDVRATMKLKRGDTCTDVAISRDAQALWDMGYFDDLAIEGDAVNGRIDLTIKVLERPAIRKVTYEGNDEVDEEDIDDAITLQPGGILSVPSVNSQLVKMRELYTAEGFFLAEVKYELRKVPNENNEVDVVYIIDEGDEVEVRRVDFIGNDELESEGLRKIMATGETGLLSFIQSNNKFNRDAFDEDLTRIQAWYYDQGYLTMQLGKPQVDLTTDRQHVDIMIPVTEGPRFRVKDIRVREIDQGGNEVEPITSAQALRGKVELESGDWFSRTKIAEGLQGISREYRDRGYAYVQVNPGIDQDQANRVADVEITIERGPLVTIERIQIRGNTKTRDAVIRREFRISEGQLYHQTKIEEGREFVNRLGYFERVDLSEEQGSGPDRIVINVEVAERSTGTFQVGAGFSSLESFLLTAQIQQQNLFGRGQSLGLNLQVSGIRQQISLQFVEPWFLGTEWSLGFGAFKTLQDFSFFRQDSTGGSVTVGHPIFNPRLRFFVQYQLQKVNIASRRGGLFGSTSGQLFDTNVQNPLSNLFQDGWTSAMRFTLSWDSRDNRLFVTTDGIFSSYSVEAAAKILGSDNVFVRQTAFFRWYKKVIGPLIFRLNTEWGLITSRKPNGVPLFERFYLGGIFTVRGYPLQGIGPRFGIPSRTDPNSPISTEGIAIGGNMQAFYNLELEFPIVESVGIRGVLFQDGGNAWNLDYRDPFGNCQGPRTSMNTKGSDPCGVNPFLRTSWGFGIRWFSPLGPLRFEWGLPIARQPGDSRIRFEFTIGNAF